MGLLAKPKALVAWLVAPLCSQVRCLRGSRLLHQLVGFRACYPLLGSPWDASPWVGYQREPLQSQSALHLLGCCLGLHCGLLPNLLLVPQVVGRLRPVRYPFVYWPLESCVWANSPLMG
jgi:hypothetical protein